MKSVLNVIQRLRIMDKSSGNLALKSSKTNEAPQVLGNGNLFTFFNTLSKNDEDLTPDEVKNIDIAVKQTSKVKKSLKTQTQTTQAEEALNVATKKKPTPNLIEKMENIPVHLGDGKFDKDNLLISTWNVNGIRQVIKKGNLKKYLDQFDVDILCVNESKIDEVAFKYENLSAELPANYSHYWNFSKAKKGYSGVAILSKYKPISVVNDMAIEKHDSEGRLITAEFDRFYLVSVYVPNAGDNCKRLDYRCKEWEPDFRAYLRNLQQKKPVILAGDLNVAQHNFDVYDPVRCRGKSCFTDEERAEFEKLLKDGWIDAYRHLNPEVVAYTYYGYRANVNGRSRGMRLDYFMCDKRVFGHVTKCEVHPHIYGSDHVPLHLHCDFAKDGNFHPPSTNTKSSDNEKVSKALATKKKTASKKSNK